MTLARRRFGHCRAAAFLLVAGCAVPPSPPPAPAAPGVIAAYTVMAGGERRLARVITTAAACPAAEFDGKTAAMAVRAGPATEPARGHGEDSKPAVFDVLTCEVEIPAGVLLARVEGQALPLPPAQIRSIVILGDTGCRMRGPFAYQDCADLASWPLAQIAGLAARLKPDLVIHVGDYHYRESPCPAGLASCAGSPWGYGFDVWNADFFQPMRPLLAAAPWVFVRGNHETCSRAGQGWFRFVAPEPWSAARSCDDPALDAGADYSAPYAVALDPDTQLIVFDSSRTVAHAYNPQSEPYARYYAEFLGVKRLAAQVPHSLFVSHHPVLAFFPQTVGSTVEAGPGDAGLQSVMRAIEPKRLFPPGVEVALHGHVHLFEALSFASDHPATLVLGNAGSYRDQALPAAAALHAEPAPGAVVKEFTSLHNFGFASLARDGAGWQLTEWDWRGEAILHCRLQGASIHCE
jgi:calcineurin-like phosphoesterase family protein